MKSDTYIPDNWDWLTPSSYDTKKQKKIKSLKQLSVPLRQFNCQSSDAIAVSQSLSDGFFISEKVPVNPYISASSLLTIQDPNIYDGSCKPYNNVDNFVKDLKYLESENFQFFSVRCLDYSWCNQDKTCTTPSEILDYTQLNDLIPNRACIADTKEKIGFTMKNVTDMSIMNDNQLETNEIRIKKFILENGPVVATLPVTDFFKTFESMKNPFEITEDVFIEKWNYLDKSFGFNFIDYITAHLIYVSIIGWGQTKEKYKYGVSDGVQLPAENIKYWILRTPLGGDLSILKVAMYPFNKFAQFDIQTNDTIPTKIVSMIPKDFGPLQGVESKSNYTGKLEHPMKYYETSVFDMKHIIEQEQLNKLFAIKEWIRKNKVLLSIIFVLIFILVLITFYFKRRQTLINVANTNLSNPVVFSFQKMKKYL